MPGDRTPFDDALGFLVPGLALGVPTLLFVALLVLLVMGGAAYVPVVRRALDGLGLDWVGPPLPAPAGEPPPARGDLDAGARGDAS